MRLLVMRDFLFIFTNLGGERFFIHFHKSCKYLRKFTNCATYYCTWTL